MILFVIVLHKLSAAKDSSRFLEFRYVKIVHKFAWRVTYT